MHHKGDDDDDDDDDSDYIGWGKAHCYESNTH